MGFSGLPISSKGPRRSDTPGSGDFEGRCGVLSKARNKQALTFGQLFPVCAFELPAHKTHVQIHYDGRFNFEPRGRHFQRYLRPRDVAVPVFVSESAESLSGNSESPCRMVTVSP